MATKLTAWGDMVNVMALCLCIRESVKMMRANGVDDGHIININSLSGHRCGKAHFYSATKHAVTALTEGIRWELREINSHIKITKNTHLSSFHINNPISTLCRKVLPIKFPLQYRPAGSVDDHKNQDI